jgi:glycerate 2-kinase
MRIAHVLVAPDKFRSTASAQAVAAACGRAATRAGHVAELLPLADGGEGLLDVVGGSLRTTIVHGPLGEEIAATWRLLDKAPGAASATAVIEMAAASGLELVGGATGNDPMAASTRGTGELIKAALDDGARRIIVGLGGSATTDGGVGALDVIADDVRLRGTEVLVACDVTTSFVFAAEVFGPQKGATPAMVGLLGRRLDALAEHYLDRFGVDVRQIPGSGAAGGLGGALAVIGGKLRSGFELVADLLGLDQAIERADLVITGEGRLDVTSFAGKVVGSLRARVAGKTQIACIVGEATTDARALAGEMIVFSLTDRYGAEKARGETEALIEATCAEFLATWSQES